MAKDRNVETEKLVVGAQVWERPNGEPWKYKSARIVAVLPDEPGGVRWVVRVWYPSRKDHRWHVADLTDFQCGKYGLWPPPHEGKWPPPENEARPQDGGSP